MLSRIRIYFNVLTVAPIKNALCTVLFHFPLRKRKNREYSRGNNAMNASKTGPSSSNRPVQAIRILFLQWMMVKFQDMRRHPSHPDKISHLLSGDSSMPMKWRAFSPYSTGA